MMAAEDWIEGDNWGDDEYDRAARATAVRALMRPKRVAGMWTTARGEQVAFKDMEHTHLLNTIAYVERQFRATQDTFCDEALDINLLWPEHAGLVAEARRRNLIPKGKKGLVTS